jgi:hypothetical protein
MKRNASPAIIPKPTTAAATAIPAIAPVLSPDDEFGDTFPVPVDDAAPAVPVIPEVEINEDIDADEEVEEEEPVAELDATDVVPGKSLRAMAWNVVSDRGFWQLTVLSGYPQQDQSPEVEL